jgi:hypothetical protein
MKDRKLDNELIKRFQALSAYLGRVEKKRLEAKKKHDDDEFIREQLSDISQKFGFVQLAYSINSLVMTGLTLAGKTLGQLAKIIPLFGPILMGICILLEMVELLFVSKETLERRAVRLFNLLVSASVTISTFVLALNPATMVPAAIISIVGSTVMVAKNGYLLYLAKKELHHASIELAAKEKQLQGLKGCDLNRSVLIKEVDELKIKVKKCQAAYAGEKLNFTTSLISFAGNVLFAVSAFAVAGLIVSNPVTLGIAALAFCGIATMAGLGMLTKQFIMKKVAPAKKTEAAPTRFSFSSVPDLAAYQAERSRIKTDGKKAKEEAIARALHDHDTVAVVVKLAANKGTAPTELAEKLVASHPTSSALSPAQNVVLSQPSVVICEDKKEDEKEGEGESKHPHASPHV